MDRMWYYAPAGSERQGPVTEAQLKDLLAGGQLSPTDLVWSEGMASWVAAGTVTEISGAPAVNAPAAAAEWQGNEGAIVKPDSRGLAMQVPAPESLVFVTVT